MNVLRGGFRGRDTESREKSEAWGGGLARLWFCTKGSKEDGGIRVHRGIRAVGGWIRDYTEARTKAQRPAGGLGGAGVREGGREKSQALQKPWWEEGGRGRSQLVGLS